MPSGLPLNGNGCCCRLDAPQSLTLRSGSPWTSRSITKSTLSEPRPLAASGMSNQSAVDELGELGRAELGEVDPVVLEPQRVPVGVFVPVGDDQLWPPVWLGANVLV